MNRKLPDMLTPAVAYRRTSLEQQSVYSLDDQEARIRAWAETNGYRIVAVYTDDGGSGTKQNRRAYQQMLADIRQLRARAVIVYDLDRLWRNLRHQLNLKDDLDKLGVVLVSISDNGVIDTSTPEGMMAFQVKGMVSEFHARTTARKVRDNLQHKASQGNWIGPVLYGYVRDGKTLALKGDTDTDAARRIFELYATNLHSDRTIADELNAAGYRTCDPQTGERKLFGREMVRSILANPGYAGWVRCKHLLLQGNHPALISQELFDRCRTIRASRDNGGRGHGRDGRMLSRLAHCAICGEVMWAHRSAGGFRYYRCAGLDHRTCTAKWARADSDAGVEHAAVQMLADLQLPQSWRTAILDAAQELGTTPAPPAQTASAATIEGQLRRLALVYADGDIDRQTYHERRDQLRLQLARVAAPPVPRATFDSAAALAALDDMRSIIAAATEAELRGLLHAVFARLWVQQHQIVAITPTEPFATLFGVIERLRIGGKGCPTGVQPPLPPLALRPYWVAVGQPFDVAA